MQLNAFQTRFRFRLQFLKSLTLLHTIARRDRSTKVPYHTLTCLWCLAHRVSVLFTPPGVLFTFLTVLYAIGHWVVFRLEVVPLHSDQVSRVWLHSGTRRLLSFSPTWFSYIPDRPSHAVRFNNSSPKCSPYPGSISTPSLLFRVRSPATTESRLMSLLAHLDVSSSGGSLIYLFLPSITYLSMNPGEFLIQKSGSMLICSEVYRSLSRLSSPPSAKAFALRPCSL